MWNIRAISTVNELNLSEYSKNDVVTHKYYVSKYYLNINCYYKSYKCLEYAFNNCKFNNSSNLKLKIILLLIPIRLLFNKIENTYKELINGNNSDVNILKTYSIIIILTCIN